MNLKNPNKAELAKPRALDAKDVKDVKDVKDDMTPQDKYLEKVYNDIKAYCEKEGLQPPHRGIINKHEMHVCAFDPDAGFKNGIYYQYLGTKACGPTTEEDWRDKVISSNKFPIHVNGNSADGSFGAVVVPHLVNIDKFLILKEWRLPIGGYAYNFPRGFPDKLENNIKTAIRELAEETNIDASKEAFVNLGPALENTGTSYNAPNYYYLPIKGQVTIKTEANSKWCAFSGEEIMQMINTGCHVKSATNGTVEGIIDSFTMVAFIKYLSYEP